MRRSDKVDVEVRKSNSFAIRKTLAQFFKRTELLRQEGKINTMGTLVRGREIARHLACRHITDAREGSKKKRAALDGPADSGTCQWRRTSRDAKSPGRELSRGFKHLRADVTDAIGCCKERCNYRFISENTRARFFLSSFLSFLFDTNVYFC